MKIMFVTGASGSGKTTLLKNIERNDGLPADFYYFDSIGVPSSEEMEARYGSGDKWQRQTTHRWVRKIVAEAKHNRAVLDGQMRLSYIAEAYQAEAFTDYQILLIDCSDTVRRARLIDRGQPELATTDMMNWAAHLRAEAANLAATILDTSELSIAQSQEKLSELLTTL